MARTRPPYFANRYCRLLTKTCAAQEIGPIAFVLCVTIVHLEDAKRYKGPVTFYNDQLMPLIGVRRWKSLDRARRRAVEFGWLHYEPGERGGHQPGRYSVTIPERLGNMDDSPCDEGRYAPKGDPGGDPTEGRYAPKGDPGGDPTEGRYAPKGDPGGDPGGEPDMRERVNSSSLRPNPNPKKKLTKKDDVLNLIEYPDGMDTLEVRKAILEWLEYKRDRKQAYKSPAKQMGKLLAIKGDDGAPRFPTPDIFVAAVDSSIASNYTGCYPAGSTQKGKTHGRTSTRPSGAYDNGTGGSGRRAF